MASPGSCRCAGQPTRALLLDEANPRFLGEVLGSIDAYPACQERHDHAMVVPGDERVPGLGIPQEGAVRERRAPSRGRSLGAPLEVGATAESRGVAAGCVGGTATALAGAGTAGWGEGCIGSASPSNNGAEAADISVSSREPTPSI